MENIKGDFGIIFDLFIVDIEFMKKFCLKLEENINAEVNTNRNKMGITYDGKLDIMFSLVYTTKTDSYESIKFNYSHKNNEGHICHLKRNELILGYYDNSVLETFKPYIRDIKINEIFQD